MTFTNRTDTEQQHAAVAVQVVGRLPFTCEKPQSRLIDQMIEAGMSADEIVDEMDPAERWEPEEIMAALQRSLA